jgi:hypothetical protein
MNADGTPAPPPGAGKILPNIPGLVGLPVHMTLTAIAKANTLRTSAATASPSSTNWRLFNGRTEQASLKP